MAGVYACLVALLATCFASALAGYPLGRYSRSLYYSPLPLYYSRPLYYPTPSDTDYYLPQEPYYPVYQSVYPGYYQRPYYYSYDEVAEPGEELADETGDYGQETWYQDNSRALDTNADVKARFLQNLILAQMYSDKYESGAQDERENGGDRWVYGEPVQEGKPKAMGKEDEDVRELKNLVHGPAVAAERRERTDKKSRKERKDKNIFAAQTRPNEWDQFRSLKADVSASRSSHKRSGAESHVTATVAPPAGQKEVVLPRPANPARAPDFQRLAIRSSQREPSVFDTIKKLLHMEEQLDEDNAPSRLKKRSYIPSEESLVAQLGRLKKMD